MGINAMIRAAILADEHAILNLASAFERFGPYRGVFENMLHQNLPALQMQQLLGEIVVDANSQRRGIAAQMLHHVKQSAQGRFISTIECLTAREDNEPAYWFFTKHGFQDRGVAGNYPRGQVAVRLVLEIPQTPNP